MSGLPEAGFADAGLAGGTARDRDRGAAGAVGGAGAPAKTADLAGRMDLRGLTPAARAASFRPCG